MEEVIYFQPGEIVTLKQDIPNKPTMIVVRAEKSIVRTNNENILKGIRCRWFTTMGVMEEEIFNTKDLIKL